ncbi:transcription-repair coupling factor [Bifidobacterium callimiconis]|uniref:Transcription-repair-coupling factor n=1 Tax=Bifidobacterium callimiconis TaxID=2306973 RepID=A0A430FIA5_9BIFI|nr:transcription-repair coupling factor [Bifidobacterium callimiconis]MBT1176287.1 transcription-repair coupling factor [Bifidobacterium callimiconis]RSX52589.1 Transcription-repair coupling factor (TRCF) [Bifidobacterium callimiconis]
MADERSAGTVDGTLVPLLARLADDRQFADIVNGGEGTGSAAALEPQLTIGAPLGIRPALAAAVCAADDTTDDTDAAPRTVIMVVPSSRDAEETAQSLRSWYAGDPNDIAVLQAWETLPHERLSPRSDTVASRMAVFRRLAHPQDGDGMFGPIRILVMPVRSLIQPVVAGLGDVEPLVFRPGEELALDDAVQRLVRNAYTRTELVMDRGEFAVRGGILDVFPPTAAHPVRIEFFGDEIDTIREFHASDQRTYGDDVPAIWATPCRELQLTDAVRARAKSLIDQIPAASDMLESIAQAIPVEGMESLLPALVDDLTPVASLLPSHSVIMLCDPERLRRASEDLNKTADEFLAASWHVAASGNGSGAPISFDEASFIDYDDAVRSLIVSDRRVWQLTDFTVDDSRDGHVQLAAEAPDEYRGVESRATAGVEGLLERGMAVTVTAAAKGTLSRLRRALDMAGIASVDYVPSCAVDGFVDEAAGLALLTERDLTGKSGVAAQAKTPKRRRKAIDLMELKPGDYVVHDQHGIGRFIEMRQRTIGSGRTRSQREYLVVEYAPSKRGAPPDRLFIPTDQLDKVSKYVGADVPKLNKLGGSDWAATKEKARKHVKRIAQDLVKLYSARQHAKGFAFSPDTPWQKELEDAFPYQETADQLTTIDEVKADMEKPVPMDRLICGDVGFGKTEIALRAAFKAVQDSKQVAVLVPTTLLVQQHYETFTERFEGFPVNVAAMSRFQTAKQLKETTEGLADGTVDVVIGTHKLLSPKIRFKDLGLVIIDEEQRFGVEHKEALKALRTNVDVLSLSATPIPRTLEMAITGIREMSTLATPPEDRLPVLTYVGAYEDAQVTAAIRRELLRGGQVFYVHNRVDGIDRLAAHIKELVPEANIGIAHGKMGEKQLDAVIRDFWHRDIDVLLCTTIIETGLDISNANTLIVDHADRFGLSQLHQLRGRVGRGRERAYAYFLYDPSKTMTQTAHDRLATIAQNTALGSGYDVAMKDLELRGTGNLLGGEQSGHIEGVGFDLYVRMVSEAVEEYKEPDRKEPVSVTIDLPVDASIPETYIDSDKLRLEAYRKMAAARDENDFRELREELTDRYGTPPAQLDTLFAVARLRARARAMGLEEIVTQGRNVRVGRIDPLESVAMRMARIYKGLQYRPLTHQYLIQTPFQGSMGSGPMDSQGVLDWTNQLLDDLSWRHRPQSSGAAAKPAKA